MPVTAEGTWKPSSPKFLAPQIFSTVTAKAHGCNHVTKGCVLSLYNLWGACLERQTLGLHQKKKKNYEYLGQGQKSCLLNKQEQVILTEADFELHPFRTKCLKRKCIWKQGQFPLPSQSHRSISFWDLGQVPYFFFTFFLSAYPFSFSRKVLICQKSGLFLKLAVHFAWSPALAIWAEGTGQENRPSEQNIQEGKDGVGRAA